MEYCAIQISKCHRLTCATTANLDSNHVSLCCQQLAGSPLHFQLCSGKCSRCVLCRHVFGLPLCTVGRVQEVLLRGTASALCFLCCCADYYKDVYKASLRFETAGLVYHIEAVTQSVIGL